MSLSMPFMPNILIKALIYGPHLESKILKKIIRCLYEFLFHLRPLHCHLTRGWRAAPLYALTMPPQMSPPSWGSPPSSALSFLVFLKSAHYFLRSYPPSSRLLPVFIKLLTLSMSSDPQQPTVIINIYSYARRRCTSHLSPDLLRYICHTDFLNLFFSS